MTDDDKALVERLRKCAEEWFEMCDDIHEPLNEAADRIEAQAVEIERLKIQLSVESEPSPYCPICGSCGDEGCCGSKRCMYPAALQEQNK